MRGFWKELEMSTPPFPLENHLVLQTLTGSRAHGTDLPGADEDLRGVIIPPRDYFLGLDRFEQYEDTADGKDVVYYDIRKFFELAMKGNPAVYAIFAGPKLKMMEPYATEILELWPHVVSKRVIAAHIGMATGHMARLGAPWRRAGQKGKDAIETHGYNTKDAGHVIRVLEQCLEMLQTGRMTFPRPNADYLCSIKLGEVPLEAIQTQAQTLIDQIRHIERTGDTLLQDAPDRAYVNGRISFIVERFLWDRFLREEST